MDIKFDPNKDEVNIGKNQIISKTGRILELPTLKEEAKINAGIAADPDTYELSDEEFAQLRPMGKPQ